jgi:hypothetical protein
LIFDELRLVEEEDTLAATFELDPEEGYLREKTLQGFG